MSLINLKHLLPLVAAYLLSQGTRGGGGQLQINHQVPKTRHIPARKKTLRYWRWSTAPASFKTPGKIPYNKVPARSAAPLTVNVSSHSSSGDTRINREKSFFLADRFKAVPLAVRNVPQSDRPRCAD